MPAGSNWAASLMYMSLCRVIRDEHVGIVGGEHGLAQMSPRGWWALAACSMAAGSGAFTVTSGLIDSATGTFVIVLR